MSKQIKSFDLQPGYAVLSVDFYKISHKAQFQKGQTKASVAHLPRKYRNNTPVFDENISVFGITPFVQDYLIDCWNNTFFNQPIKLVVKNYVKFIRETLMIEEPEVEHIKQLHKLGYLPIELRALKEGLRAPTGVPHWTIESTHDDFDWLPGYLETAGLSSYWKIMTIANISFDFKWLFEKYAAMTCEDNSFVPFQVHDFSARSHETPKGAAINGMGHLVHFLGTDTCSSIVAAKYFYPTENMIGTSVSATEHSTMSSNIKYIKKQLEKHGKWKRFTIKMLQFDESHTNLTRLAEIAYVWYLLADVYPDGILSVVMDTYDYWYMIEYGLEVLKPIIMSRNGKLVVRPDSGNPEDIIFGKQTLEVIKETKVERDNRYGYFSSTDFVNGIRENGFKYYKFIDAPEYYQINKSSVKQITEEEYLKTITVEEKGTLAKLEELFGTTVNKKGYKELDSHIGLIYGDSITVELSRSILKTMKDRQFASNNIVVGVGSGYQKITRDSYGNAVKLHYAIIDDEEYQIKKDPKTDKSKQSPAGRLAVIQNPKTLELTLQSEVTESMQNSDTNMLKPLFKNGDFIKARMQSLDNVRETSHYFIDTRLKELGLAS